MTARTLDTRTIATYQLAMAFGGGLAIGAGLQIEDQLYCLIGALSVLSAVLSVSVRR
jgi:hypothetical protein